MAGLLLLAIVALPNVLAYADPFTRFFGRPFDWTRTDLNAISQQTRNMLANLEEPVKVYVFLDPEDPVGSDSQTLLENCRSLSSKFKWETVNPSTLAGREKLIDLARRYALSDAEGWLIIQGEESDKNKTKFVFVPSRDLIEQTASMAAQDRTTYGFLGESALRSALEELSGGKTVIYFTSGHGEYSLDMPTDFRARQTTSLSELKSKFLERKGVEVKALELTRFTKSIPEDASVVVVAGPQDTFDPHSANLLSEYVKRERKTEKEKDENGVEKVVEKTPPGRLLLLLEPVVRKETEGTRIIPTGLEKLLSDYGVNAGADFVQILANENKPRQVPARFNPKSKNPIAQAFGRVLLPFQDARSVIPAPAPPPGKSVEALLVPLGQHGPFVETNPARDPVEVVSKLLAGPEYKLRAVLRGDLSIAVAVSQSSAPADPFHKGMNADPSTSSPRMIVFGASKWVLNEEMKGGVGELRGDLFNSCVSWLRERAAIGQKEGVKTRQAYRINIDVKDKSRVRELPLGLMVLGVVGVGAGVWVVRRR